MIINFKCSETEKLFKQRFSKKLPQSIHYRAFIELNILAAATCELDLLIPNSNQFEHLSGNLKGCCSIRINKQYRLIFKFENGNAYDVYITDYH